MIQALDNGYLSPLLREHGFTKRGLTWNRASGEIVHVLNMQKSRTSGPDRAEVTLNVGVWLQSVWTICWNKEALDFAEEDDCFPRFRIGSLLADFRLTAKDLWWSLTNEDDVAKVGVELRRLIDESCLPFLNRFRSMRDVKTFCDATTLRLMPADKLYYAILSYLTGDRARYDTLLGELADKKLQAWRPRITEVKSRLEHQE